MGFLFDYQPRRRFGLAAWDAQLDPADQLSKLLLSCWLPWGLLMKDVAHGYDMFVAYGTVTAGPGALGVGVIVVGDNGVKTGSLITDFHTQASGGVSVWFQPTTLAAADRSIIFKGNGANGMTLYHNSAGVVAAKLNPTAGGSATTLVGTTALTPNKPTHVSLQWRQGGLSELYVNGHLEASDPATATFDMDNVPVWLPGEAFSGFPENGIYHRADWYRRALSAAEVAAFAASPFRGLRPRRGGRDDLLYAYATPAGPVGWGDVLSLGEPAGPSDPGVSWEDTLTLGDEEAGEGIILDVNFGDTGESLQLRSEFRVETGDLGNGRYRR